MDRLISEQAVFKTIDNLKANFTCYDSVTLDEVYSHVKAIPSAYKGMINGEVVKAVFPNAEYKHIKTMSGIDGMEVKGINGLYDNFGQWCARDIFFHDDWWNSPYEPQESEDI